MKYFSMKLHDVFPPGREVFPPGGSTSPPGGNGKCVLPPLWTF